MKKILLDVNEKDIFLCRNKIITMKRLLTILLVVFSINLNAQTSLTTAVDFTATDCNGNTINLFEILDRGQYVLIDFFYYNCGPCQKACPKLVEAYKAYGCNEHDIFFMEISYTDSDAKCQEWEEQYGVKYPTIGAEGGGYEIADIYEIQSFPTVILISPRKTILINDFPYIESAQTIIDKIAATTSLIEEHPCSDNGNDDNNDEGNDDNNDEGNDDGTTGYNEILDNSFRLYPNPASSYVKITSNITEKTEVKIMDITGRCVKNINVESLKDATISIEDLEKGIYFIRINDKIEKLIVE